MRGDFSRLRFEKTKHYTAVLEQQGRVSLDADHNEQRAIDSNLRETEAIDIIGPFGGPEHDAGFAITTAGSTIQIGAGRYYVQGLLCEQETALTYGTQPYLINPAISDFDLLTELAEGTIDSIRLFLQVMQRLVTTLDDHCLREPALGQADTTVRLQTVWRVVAQATKGSSPRTQPGPPINLRGRALMNRAALMAGTNRAMMMTSRAGTGVSAARTTLGGTAVNRASLSGAARAESSFAGRSAVGTSLPRTSAAGVSLVGTSAGTTPVPVPIDCCVEMYQPQVEIARGTLSAQTLGGSSACSCEPTPAAGFRGLENQLYRVEIHEGGSELTATCKWSRENGSVVLAVSKLSGADVVVESLGFDANLGFQPGQWVELSDDTFLFGPVPNRPGELCQIKSINAEQNTITMTAAPALVDTARNARLRRWEQFGTSATSSGVALAAGSWLDLENGIQVQFAPGNFESGDYWLIPARTATGQVEWPPCGSDGTTFQPPHHAEPFMAPLACIHWDANKQSAVVKDCRRTFPPLTEVAGGDLAALHVTAINWPNDDVVAFDQLLATGLAITLDNAPTGRIDTSIFDLTLEVPVPSQIEPGAVKEGLTPIVLRTCMPLDGQITTQKDTVTWNIPFRDAKGKISGVQLQALAALDFLLLQGVNYAAYVRARVRLRGADVYAGDGSSRMYLDGQALGDAGVRADGATPRMDLKFPSGSGSGRGTGSRSSAGGGASDFTSWFYLVPTLTLASLTVTPATIVQTPTLPNPPAPVATLTVIYPVLEDTAVTLSAIPPAGVGAFVTVPATVTIPAGKASVQFPVSVGNTQILTPQIFEIVASKSNALGFTNSVTANLTVTGFVVIG